MDLRPTKMNEGAMDWCRGVNNLDRAFNRVFSTRIPETVKHPRRFAWLTELSSPADEMNDFDLRSSAEFGRRPKNNLYY